MKKRDEIGAIIEYGAQSWQVYQQNRNGTADITFGGRWVARQPFKQAVVRVRLLFEDTFECVSPAFEWIEADTRKDKTWQVTLINVPRGGLYRIETVLQLDAMPEEWAVRGDIVHHVGVGDVWVITGQSNAAGYGKTPATDGPEMGVHMFHARGEWTLGAHPLGDSAGTLYPANREGGNASHSPWLAFAKALRKSLGYPIGLIPASLGGSAMVAWDRKEGGHLFENMLRYIEDSGGKIRGVVWYQGESDASPELAKKYTARFRRFVGDLRRTMKDPSLPVITAQLNRCVCGEVSPKGEDGWTAMREVQRQIARKMRNVFVVSTIDTGLSDGIHVDSPGNVVIGERMASVALGQVHGLGVKCLHPDCAGARLVEPKVIEIAFDNVDKRLHYESFVSAEFPFAVRDKNGRVPTVVLRISAPDKIQVVLGRDPVGRTRVTGAPTANPPRIVPFDMSGFRPMLGFTVEVDE